MGEGERGRLKGLVSFKRQISADREKNKAIEHDGAIRAHSAMI
jgi:hypothetical protein